MRFIPPRILALSPRTYYARTTETNWSCSSLKYSGPSYNGRAMCNRRASRRVLTDQGNGGNDRNYDQGSQAPTVEPSTTCHFDEVHNGLASPEARNFFLSLSDAP